MLVWFHWVLQHIDGQPLDVLTVFFAVMFPAVRGVLYMIGFKPAQDATTKDFVADLLNGGVIAPFGMMIVGGFNEEVMKMVIAGGHPMIAISGAIGLFYVLTPYARALKAHEKTAA